MRDYGTITDKNGYADSIVQKRQACYNCGRQGLLCRHEPLDGIGRRYKSKALGLWVWLCPACHSEVHNIPAEADMLRADCERAALRVYGWDKERFIKEFGKNYL